MKQLQITLVISIFLVLILVGCRTNIKNTDYMLQIFFISKRTISFSYFVTPMFPCSHFLDNFQKTDNMTNEIVEYIENGLNCQKIEDADTTNSDWVHFRFANISCKK